MKRNKIYFLLLVIGVTAGVFWGLLKARADTPEGKSSQGEDPASVYYDETWNATGAVISTKRGYANFDPSVHQSTAIAAEFENGPSDERIKVFPKFVVKEWTVHGHIHFE